MPDITTHTRMIHTNHRLVSRYSLLNTFYLNEKSHINCINILKYAC
ncbi:hypothetical protein LX69_02651 [Breznakibacter xylanolyticus]|uniref:Uncharacterized protein n=1 Tax=Breznakibacter xylanolyticus TaxID=990 RepID=A0A2W7N0E5_9BACT|nr:hypothetical protein LX69_02651 [Breznakibacter xylanolyticus]